MKWIPVTERLPDHQANVIVWNSYIEHWDKDWFSVKYRAFQKNINKDVTHWMEITPPESEQ
jgi:hypothetical protein